MNFYDMIMWMNENSSSDDNENVIIKKFVERSITNIDIPSDVTFIGSHAFYNCQSLTDISIPSSVTSIGSYAFYNCQSLTDINIPSGVTSIGSNAFEYCGKLTNINIPFGVTSISGNLFAHCALLTSVDIPSSVTSIGSYAFYSSSSLSSIICRATSPPTLQKNSLSIVKDDCIIYVPFESVDAYKAASYWSNKASYIQAIQE